MNKFVSFSSPRFWKSSDVSETPSHFILCSIFFSTHPTYFCGFFHTRIRTFLCIWAQIPCVHIVIQFVDICHDLTTKDGPEANFVVIKVQLWSEIPFFNSNTANDGQQWTKLTLNFNASTNIYLDVLCCSCLAINCMPRYNFYTYWTHGPGLQIEGVLAYFTHLKCQKRIGDDVGERQIQKKCIYLFL
jgi:hypothetical protein